MQYGLEQQNYPFCSPVKYSKNTYMCAGKEGDWVWIKLNFPLTPSSQTEK